METVVLPTPLCVPAITIDFFMAQVGLIWYLKYGAVSFTVTG
jgi:hypothetical protein